MRVRDIPCVPLPVLKKCPPAQIILVPTGDSDDGESMWVFGPGTVHRWPHGDYQINNVYREIAFQTYPDFLQEEYRDEYMMCDPAYLMDIGL